MYRRSTRLHAGLVAVAIIIPTLLVAQSPRFAVLEEGTNASCPPCAAQNPTYEAYIRKARLSTNVISLTYHTWWPGRDVMYNADTSISQVRVPYYGFSGVPTAIVGGKYYQGAPADTLSIGGAVERITNMISPITITIEETRNGNDVAAKVTVSSIEKLNGTLHIAVVEDVHYYASAGNNGEKYFHDVVRKMLPTPSGQAVNLTAGGSYSTTQNFVLDPEWTAEDIHIVAFVQASNKEILQGATTQQKEADILLTARRSAIGSGPGATYQWQGAVTSKAAGSYNVTVTKDLPVGWTSSVTIKGEDLTAGGVVALLDNGNVPIDVMIDPAGSTDLRGMGDVTVSISGDSGIVATKIYRYYASDIIALVYTRHEFTSPQISTSYDAAMNKGDVKYAVVYPSDEDLFDMQEHVIVYEVGKYALRIADVAELKRLMDSGGARLYLIGAEIGYGLADPGNTDAVTPRNIPFMQNYLHANYTKDANTSATVSGVAGDPVGDGMTFSIKTGVNNQDTPDEFTVRTGALPAFYYGSTQSAIAGLRYADTRNRLIFLGFGAEGIGDVNQRADLLKKGITWLMGSERTLGVDLTRNNPLTETVGAIRPNPTTTGRFALPINLAARGHVSVVIYSMGGERVARVVDETREAGAVALDVDVSSLPDGCYTVVTTVDGGAIARMIMIMR